MALEEMVQFSFPNFGPVTVKTRGDIDKKAALARHEKDRGAFKRKLSSIRRKGTVRFSFFKTNSSIDGASTHHEIAWQELELYFQRTFDDTIAGDSELQPLVLFLSEAEVDSINARIATDVGLKINNARVKQFSTSGGVAFVQLNFKKTEAKLVNNA